MREMLFDKGIKGVKEVAEPLLSDHFVLVGVHYSFVSSKTEVSTIIDAKPSYFDNIPRTLKKVLDAVQSKNFAKNSFQSNTKPEVYSLCYSCSGQVLAVGKNVKGLRVGDWVACAGAGYAHHADMVCVPEHLTVKLPSNALLKAASLTTLGAAALQGIRRAELQLGERVCIIGLGILGQLSAQLAKLSGCTVIGIDVVKERIELAKTLAADHVFHAFDQNVEKEIALLTEHHGVDTCIITAVSQDRAIVQRAMEITRKKGRVVMVGDVKLDIAREPFYKKEIDLLMSCSYGPGRYDPRYEYNGVDYPYAYVRWTESRNMAAFIQLLAQHKLDVSHFIQQELTARQIQEVCDRIETKKIVGAVLSYDGVDKDIFSKHIKTQTTCESISSSCTRFVPAKKDCIRVGIMGVGDFAQRKILPHLDKIRNISMSAIADINLANLMEISEQYPGAKALVSDDELFEKDLVDAIVVASPDKFHCDHALKALSQSKAVFMAKPMVTSFEQLHKFKEFLTQNPHAVLCVDYCRSFAPFIQKIKKVVQKRTSPLLAHYRMSTNFMTPHQLLQTELGAGRIIGQACYAVDIFCYLTDAKPIAVSVEALHASRSDVFPTDNFSCQISFDDGSVCSLLYTALGHENLSNERMELFFDRKSIIMDDYVGLYGFGLSSWFNESVSTQDRGHEALLKTFFTNVQKKEYVPPIDYERLLTVAYLTLMIDYLACAGGGSMEYTQASNVGGKEHQTSR